MWGSAVVRSAISSMSKKTAPGTCASSNSRRAFRCNCGMCQVPSTTRTRGFLRFSASHSVLTTRPGLLKAAGPRAAFLRAPALRAVGRAERFPRRLTVTARRRERRDRDRLPISGRPPCLRGRSRTPRAPHVGPGHGSPRLSRVAELGELGQALEREHALVLLAVDHPGGIGAHPRPHAALVDGLVIPEGIAFHVRQALRGRPEPGLLLFARGSPVGAIENR